MFVATLLLFQFKLSRLIATCRDKLAIGASIGAKIIQIASERREMRTLVSTRRRVYPPCSFFSFYRHLAIVNGLRFLEPPQSASPGSSQCLEKPALHTSCYTRVYARSLEGRNDYPNEETKWSKRKTIGWKCWR